MQRTKSGYPRRGGTAGGIAGTKEMVLYIGIVEKRAGLPEDAQTILSAVEAEF